MRSTLHPLAALLNQPTEHEDGRVLEQIWTAVKTITTISVDKKNQLDVTFCNLYSLLIVA